MNKNKFPKKLWLLAQANGYYYTILKLIQSGGPLNHWEAARLMEEIYYEPRILKLMYKFAIDRKASKFETKLFKKHWEFSKDIREIEKIDNYYAL